MLLSKEPVRIVGTQLERKEQGFPDVQPVALLSRVTPALSKDISIKKIAEKEGGEGKCDFLM